MLNAPEWKQALLGSSSAVVFGGIQPVYAYAMGSMISVYFLKDHDEIKSKTRTYALIFSFLSVLSLLINIGQHYSFGAMGEYLTKRLRERMLSKMLTFEVGWFDQDENSTGAICSRLAKDANVVSIKKMLSNSPLPRFCHRYWLSITTMYFNHYETLLENNDAENSVIKTDKFMKLSSRKRVIAGEIVGG